MPSPRVIALQKNDSAKFARDGAAYDPVAGTPTSDQQTGGKPADYRANPVNPPHKSSEVKNLKS
jgi:hypothetical protein